MYVLPTLHVNGQNRNGCTNKDKQKLESNPEGAYNKAVNDKFSKTEGQKPS